MERDISDIEARIAAIPIEKETIFAESRSAVANLEQRSIDAGTRWTQTVLSPIAGRVAALPVSVGQAIAAGATVAVVIPEGPGSKPSCWRPRARRDSSAPARRCI